ncbi:Protein Mpv17 [Zostera marina]|uniref:Protein Mpv17 n=1 Tax=Zostera marina TaxID=29655 RepID=A0A0K9P6N9_ZOSMR|nr:Protein Mpv17 [Zostera marina]
MNPAQAGLLSGWFAPQAGLGIIIWVNQFHGNSKSSGSGDGSGTFEEWRFPLKPAVTSASLVLAGDAIAQVRQRFLNLRLHSNGEENPNPHTLKDIMTSVLDSHDWVRALRMVSYGFLLYGPGSYSWYQFLDRSMAATSLTNISIKVLLNQIVLGPCVIAVVFAWNNLWQNKLSELPGKYQKDALPTLVYGFRFWIPVSIMNFGLVPLPARVAFMSACSVFWNFYLSTTMFK